MAGPVDTGRGRDLVAVILAIGLATSVTIMVGAVFWDAVRSDTPGLSENATQVIIAAFTGITGVLGGYVGGRAVERAHQLQNERQEPPDGRQSPAQPSEPPEEPEPSS